jgi:Lecithin retinol acyltransferase
MAGRFQPGDQLQVRRWPGYYHHGIYVSDDRVIQFGSGLSLLDKAATTVNAVSLAKFEGTGAAEVVRHGYNSGVTGWHPPADQPWQIIERAEFLLKLQPKLPYNLIGHNCEHMANLCSVNRWAESYQVRRFFAAKLPVSIATRLGVAWFSRRKRPLPSWLTTVAIGGAILTFAVKTTCDLGIKKLWDEIRDDWFEHERMLADDPRSEQA